MKRGAVPSACASMGTRWGGVELYAASASLMMHAVKPHRVQYLESHCSTHRRKGVYAIQASGIAIASEICHDEVKMPKDILGMRKRRDMRRLKSASCSSPRSHATRRRPSEQRAIAAPE